MPLYTYAYNIWQHFFPSTFHSIQPKSPLLGKQDILYILSIFSQIHSNKTFLDKAMVLKVKKEFQNAIENKKSI